MAGKVTATALESISDAMVAHIIVHTYYSIFRDCVIAKYSFFVLHQQICPSEDQQQREQTSGFCSYIQ